jgi:hypothetical protein
MMRLLLLLLAIPVSIEDKIGHEEEIVPVVERVQDKGTILLRSLNFKQRKALELFKSYEVVTSRQIGELFGFSPRTGAGLCKKWVEVGFLQVVDPSNKARKYKLADLYNILV